MRQHFQALTLASIFLCSIFLCSVPSASSIPADIFYSLGVYADYAVGTVTFDPDSEMLSYAAGTVVTVTIIPEPDGAYTRFVYGGVEGSGLGSYTGDATTFQVTMNGDIEEYIIWHLQYLVEFETAGISGATGSATIVTIDGAPKTAAQLPFSAWYDSGAVVSFTYNSPVSGIYVLTGMTVTRTDASGHLITDTATGSYTVSAYATISGLYAVTTTTSTTTTSPATTTTGGAGGGYTPPPTAPSGGLDILGVFGGFSDTLRDFWGTISNWGSGTSGSGRLSMGTFSRWLNGSVYEVPNMAIILLAIMAFIILLIWRRRRNGK